MNENDLIRASLELEAAFLDDLGEPQEAAKVRSRVPLASADADRLAEKASAPHPDRSSPDSVAEPDSGDVRFTDARKHGAPQDVTVVVDPKPSEKNDVLTQARYIRAVEPPISPVARTGRHYSGPRFRAPKVDLELMQRIRDLERVGVGQVVGSSAFWTAVSGGLKGDGGTQSVTQHLSRPNAGLTERPKESA